jgi:predicted aldo/keto reductase-like oxidoreductase
MTRQIAVVLCLVAAAAIGYSLGGSLLHLGFEDVGPSAWWFGDSIQAALMALDPTIDTVVVGPVWLVILVLALGIASFFAVRAASRGGEAGEISNVGSARRSILVGAGASVLALGGAVGRSFFGVGNSRRAWQPVFQNIFLDQEPPKTHGKWNEAWKGSRIAAYRRMGRTEFQVSDIVLGAGRLSGDKGVEVVRAALDRGVNYIDTAPDYSASGSERAIGEALKGRRDAVFLATKFCTPLGNLPTGTPVADYKAAVEESLGRLQTDYVDLVHIHGCDSVDRLLDPNVHEAFDQLKAEGKARFLGFSSHTPRLLDVANAAIESKRFDVMMLAYHHGIWPEMKEAISRARREADMGVVAMKTLKGGKHRGLMDFAPYADAYSQAALKWALSNEDLSAAIISFFEPQHVDEYLFASGQPFNSGDVAVLEEYDRQTAGTHCAPHCGDCLDSCPAGLPIHDVLRFRMYFEDYGWEKEGISQYSKLGTANASLCEGCPAPCTNTCPLGIDIKTRMTGAHDLLSLV